MSIHRIIALIFTLTLGLVACGSNGPEGPSGDDESSAVVETSTSTAAETKSSATTTPTTAPEILEPEESAPTESIEPEEQAPNNSEPEPAVFDADAPEFVEWGLIEPGNHRVTVLGTPITFTLDEEWSVFRNQLGYFVLGDPASTGPGDRGIVFVRVAGLADPDAPNANREDQTGWPLDDIEGWLDNLAEGITITNRQTVNLGGRTAVRFDLRVEDDFECGTQYCMGFVTDGGDGGESFDPGIDFRIHWIDEGDSPIVVMLSSGRVGAAFFERAEAMLATLAFGDTQPHPIDPELPLWEQGLATDVPAGRANFPSVGVSFELADERFVIQPAGLVGVLQRTNSGIYMFKASSDLEGNPLATSDAVVDAILADITAEATEVDVSAVSEYPIRELNLLPGRSTTFGLKWNDRPEGDWTSQPFTRLWVIDTPDGIVVLSAESEDESTFEGAVTEALGIIATLQTIPRS